MENIVKIMKLSESRIDFLHNKDNAWWYQWYNTYINAIKDELKEVEDEIKEKNSIYLEDEMWDIFWSFICLMNSLKQDKLIDKNKVFERCLKKYEWRLWSDVNFKDMNWQETKKQQKEELLKEHNNKYGK